MQTVDPTSLAYVLLYEPVTGVLTWLPRSGPAFLGGNQGVAKTWNAKNAGKPALNNLSKAGYRVGKVFNQPLLAHRVAWCLHYGSWPKGQVDHINGDRSDNRISNLRDVTAQENSRNQKRFASNSSGHTGVYWHEKDARWLAAIRVGPRLIHLGSFSEKQDAVNARRQAEQQIGFHPEHGRRV